MVPNAEDTVTIGADQPVHDQENAEQYTQEEDREYRRRALWEEKEIFQQRVEDAPSHEGYVPKQTWDGMEMVGGETEWDSGRRIYKGCAKVTSTEECT